MPEYIHYSKMCLRPCRLAELHVYMFDELSDREYVTKGYMYWILSTFKIDVMWCGAWWHNNTLRSTLEIVSIGEDFPVEYVASLRREESLLNHDACFRVCQGRDDDFFPRSSTECLGFVHVRLAVTGKMIRHLDMYYKMAN